MNVHSTPTAVLVCCAALVVSLTACSSQGEPQHAPQPPATATESGTATASSDVPTHKPQRIAALSSDVASLVAAIAEPENIALIADIGERTPEGPQVLRGDHNVDPEQILSAEPDLVLLTSRHGQEQDAAALIEQSAIPVVQFDGGDTWSSIDAILANIDELGSLLGEEERAAQLRSDIEETRARVHEQIPEGQAPRVLPLMARGEQRMVVPPSALLHGLVAEAGAEALTGTSGGRGPAPADPELIAALNPDVIVIEDFQGRGTQDFAEILSNPALSHVPAVATGRVHFLPSDLVTVAGAADVGDGLAAVVDAIYHRR
ncbi:ABC transporter substrate-binding protein [Corynebacterium timonense]|uniref:Iron complex transport system substrate-binding protein n=1 Tax=Corynebacterium timonense TaxID=441500 RepID=A0A1H1LC06_9CORY|nr:ABC transporter substrate-binding protein [Corynebacterium timonense]SDR71890.1 iron complex transport system substrate-binding protein [Corynebacterium timonense]